MKRCFVFLTAEMYFMLLNLFCCNATASQIDVAVDLEVAHAQTCTHKTISVDNLAMDEAVVRVSTDVKNIKIYYQSLECWECSLKEICNLSKPSNASFKLDINYGSWIVAGPSVEHANITSCIIRQRLIQHGEYALMINHVPDSLPATYECEFFLINEPMDPFIPIYVVVGSIVLATILWVFGSLAYRRWHHRLHCRCRRRIESPIEVNAEGSSDYAPVDSREEAASSIIAPSPRTQRKERLKSLDTFRGLSLVVMIFVNYGSGGYKFFAHSPWNGLSLADLVFPWFVFIMGTSMALVAKSRQWQQQTRLCLFWRVLRRFALLFILGLLLSNSGKPVTLDDVRIPGVLQRFAATYLAVSLLLIVFRDRTAQAADVATQARWRQALRDILPFWPEWLAIGLCVTLHCLLTFLLPLGDHCPTGYLGPGGLHDDGRYANCTGGAAGAIDRWLFGSSHIYQRPTCLKVYDTTVPYDPEGVLGTLMSIVIACLGLQAGRVVVFYVQWKTVVHRWLIWTVVTFFIGGILCQFQQNTGWIPLNKNLWSLSYVLIMASTSFFLLTVFYVVIDVCHLWSGAPLIFPGMNSIVVYVGHEMFRTFPVQFYVPPTHAYLLAMNIWGCVVWTVIAWLMYKQKFFISL